MSRLSCPLCACGRTHCVRGRSIMSTVLTLVCAFVRLPRPVGRMPNTFSRAQTWSVGHDINALSQHHPQKPWCDIKSFVATGLAHRWENSVTTQGDPCRVPSLAQPPNPIEIQNSCGDTRSNNLYCDPNRPIGMGTMSRHEGLCPKSSSAHTWCARSGQVMCLA